MRTGYQFLFDSILRQRLVDSLPASIQSPSKLVRPHKFNARKFMVEAAGTAPASEVIISHTLSKIKVPRHTPGGASPTQILWEPVADTCQCAMRSITLGEKRRFYTPINVKFGVIPRDAYFV